MQMLGILLDYLIYECHPVTLICVILLLIVCHVAYDRIRNRIQINEMKWVHHMGEHRLEVEETSISRSSSDRVQRWIHAIDKTNSSFDEKDREFGVMNGESVVGLMKAYEMANFPSARFVCLRIYQPSLFSCVTSEADGDGDDDTVALVFLTVLDEFDPVTYFPRVLQRALDFLHLSGPLRRLLTMRLAMSSFHWPFRPSVFLTRAPADIVRRRIPSTHSTQTSSSASASAEAYMRILTRVRLWNANLPKSERISILLASGYKGSSFSQAIIQSGLPQVPIPPTYLLDLRPFRGIKVSAYINRLKKQGCRIRVAPFKKAGGKVSIQDSLDEEHLKFIINGSAQIEDKRRLSDSTPIFFSPTPSFLTALASNPSSTRSFLFLSLSGHTLASSVIFRFSPSLLTSDIAGFDYEKLDSALRESGYGNAKLYPVKMASVLELALTERYDFLDLGPTTGSSKTQLGCKEIHMNGGVYCQSVAIQAIATAVAWVVATAHTHTQSKKDNEPKAPEHIKDKSKNYKELQEEKEEDDEEEERQKEKAHVTANENTQHQGNKTKKEFDDHKRIHGEDDDLLKNKNKNKKKVELVPPNIAERTPQIEGDHDEKRIKKTIDDSKNPKIKEKKVKLSKAERIAARIEAAAERLKFENPKTAKEKEQKTASKLSATQLHSPSSPPSSGWTSSTSSSPSMTSSNSSPSSSPSIYPCTPSPLSPSPAIEKEGNIITSSLLDQTSETPTAVLDQDPFNSMSPNRIIQDQARKSSQQEQIVSAA